MPTPDSQRDDIPGFDPEQEEYVRLDTDAWLHANRVRETGRERGEKNQPPADAVDLDDIHLKIRRWVNQRGLQCHSDVSRHLSGLARQLTDIENQEDLTILEQKVDQEKGEAIIEINNRAKRGRDELAQPGKAVREGTREYEDFRVKAGLYRLPHEGRRAFVLSLIIIFFGVLETFLNAFLLMDVNPFGLLGGIAQMGLITAVNILIGALVVGFALRCRNLGRTTHRAAAWLVVIVIVPSIGGFNLLVGHFRDSMQAIGHSAADPLTMLTNDTLQRMTSAPLGLDSFQSVLLVILGMLFFGIASWKGYQWDDPYPGYGRRHRQLKALNEEYRRVLEKAQDEVGQVYSDRKKLRLEDMRHRLEIKADKWKDLHERGERLVREYKLHVRQQYQDDLDYLIAVYRTENENVRSESRPRFFSERLKIDDGILQAPSFNHPRESRKEDVAKRIHDAIMHIQGVYETALEGFPSLEKVMAGNPVHDAGHAEVIHLPHAVATGDDDGLKAIERS